MSTDKRKSRRVSVQSTALLGKECEEVLPLIAVWPTTDGLGGSSPSRADTVHIVAFSRGDMTLAQCEAAGMPGGCQLIGKTTIRDMVRYEVEAGLVGSGMLDARYAHRFRQLRQALIDAAQDIADAIREVGHAVGSHQNITKREGQDHG